MSLLETRVEAVTRAMAEKWLDGATSPLTVDDMDGLRRQARLLVVGVDALVAFDLCRRPRFEDEESLLRHDRSRQLQRVRLYYDGHHEVKQDGSMIHLTFAAMREPVTSCMPAEMARELGAQLLAAADLAVRRLGDER